MHYPHCPNPDKVALLRTGAHVRRRLAANPAAHKVAVDGAELWSLGKFLSDSDCDILTKIVDSAARPSAVLDHGYNEVWRTSYSGDVDPTDPFIKMVERRIDDLLGLPGEWGETIQGQRYEPGQEFKEHMDWFWTHAPYWKTEAKRGGQRAFTAMVFLNDVAAGGETHFPNIGVTITPERGALLIWNNAGPDGSLNQNTLHAGTKVTDGVKYIITKWYRSRPWNPHRA